MAALVMAVVLMGAWILDNARTAVRAEDESGPGARASGEDVRPIPTQPAGALVATPASAGLEGMAAAASPSDASTPVPAPTESGGDGDLPARIRQAELRRERLRQRVATLRRRTDSPEISTAREYERLLDEIKATYAELDRARAELAGLRRAASE
ncbi:MAG TPA: hypothetical protein VMR21_01445 [Vicinamibacteria bacterium]|nr:hypothetical protein [Vicinamibacteria bacterium]